MICGVAAVAGPACCSAWKILKIGAVATETAGCGVVVADCAAAARIAGTASNRYGCTGRRVVVAL